LLNFISVILKKNVLVGYNSYLFTVVEVNVVPCRLRVSADFFQSSSVLPLDENSLHSIYSVLR